MRIYRGTFRGLLVNSSYAFLNSSNIIDISLIEVLYLK
jgi:hypothetical protein